MSGVLIRKIAKKEDLRVEDKVFTEANGNGIVCSVGDSITIMFGCGVMKSFTEIKDMIVFMTKARFIGGK